MTNRIANGNGQRPTNGKPGHGKPKAGDAPERRPLFELTDRQPPFDAKAELGVIGSMILMQSVCDEVSKILRPEDFYDSAHEIMYRHLLALHETGKAYDDTLIVNRLKKAGDWDHVGGAAYLTQIVNAVPNAAHATYYAEIVRDKAIYRKVILRSTELLRDAYDEFSEPQKLLADADAAFSGVSDQFLTAQEPRAINAVALEAMAALDERMGGQIQGTPTGIAALDHVKRLKSGELIILAARPAMGKCLGRGTLVLMHDGTKRPVETIRVGDRLMGPDSLPRTVLALGQGTAQMYAVNQAYGVRYRVNGDHILVLARSKTEGRHKRGTVIEISVSELLKKPKSWLSRWRGFKAAVEYPRTAQPLEPYFLGLWLGDGAAASGRISSADTEIEDYLRDYATRRGARLAIYRPKKSKASEYTIAAIGRDAMTTHWSVKATLGRLNLLNNKHIPRCYMVASREQRLLLLAGLVDSDGHYSTANNAFDITMTDRRLIEEIKELADSLGFRASITYKRKRCQTGAVSDAWALMIRGNIEDIPTKLPRKRPRKKWGQYEGSDARWSTLQIEPDGVDEYFGFSLDGDGRFLLSDGTVTHNTALACNIAVHAVKHSHYPVVFFSLEMHPVELTDRILCAEARVDYGRMLRGSLSAELKQDLVNASLALANLPLYIDDAAGKTVTQIAAHCRQLKRKHGGLALVIVDYLQLVEPDDQKVARQEQVAKISRRLKLMARTLGVPVLALAQVNRQAEQNKDCRPRLSHLRESGSIEADADMVLFCHRPAYYDKTIPEGQQAERAELLLAKGRNVPMAQIDMHWFGHWQRWDNPAPAHTEAGGQPWTPNSYHDAGGDF